ncbi:hypothetical protein CC1G_12657 [Coprinopsis cinerea okayama7|uniref:Uncharacterized protein n=1 Tax=Coprinopsis cinerea (strain Okayama-7 / 130 / ATCC MYA-4618 / FGSC 9003) TaxID=240176 RepID=A8N1D3_COPC7|nr:hypothetical protein CC1G_12657 [Coprinopsis cinerea okayama7\|eukprot:XP_001828682.2 hypothetical protein CC1G_12657 [Coprinopsis cinerea okayama7\
MALLWGSQALSVLQVPMHPFLLLLSFNVFSSSVNPWVLTAVDWWGKLLTLSGPLFIAMEGLSSLLVAQKLGQEGKKLIGVEQPKGEFYQFALLIGTAVAFVASAYWIVDSYPSAASSPLSSTLLGVALTTFLFLTVIGFVMRRTNIIESSGLAVFIAYNVWLCDFDQASLPTRRHHPVLIALLYRLTILHSASRILPTIGADSWEGDGDEDNEWDRRPTSTLTRLLLTYKQFIFVTVYSHLLLLDHSSQIWWRWINIFFTLFIWSIELVVSSDDEVSKEWKID